ncbi:hypothetical protein D3C87_1325510 [compost metagenome]
MFLAHQHVNATVIIAGIVERCDAIFLGPVGFEIGKRLIVETTNQRQGVGVGFEFAQVLAMLFEAALLLPETRDPRTVLPPIETRQIDIDVHRAQGNPHPQSRIETPVNLAAWLGRSQGMALAATDDHLLGIAVGQRLHKPRLRQLPE